MHERLTHANSGMHRNSLSVTYYQKGLTMPIQKHHKDLHYNLLSPPSGSHMWGQPMGARVCPGGIAVPPANSCDRLWFLPHATAETWAQPTAQWILHYTLLETIKTLLNTKPTNGGNTGHQGSPVITNKMSKIGATGRKKNIHWNMFPR